MLTIEEVSGTAFVVAEYRAEENREAAPIYRDPVVGVFLSDASRQAAERVSSRFPHVHAARDRQGHDTAPHGAREAVPLSFGYLTEAPPAKSGRTSSRT